jgi:hypothetical protein
MNDDSAPRHPNEPFFSLVWHIVSGFAIAGMFITLLALNELGIAFIGLTILVAGHTVARAIRGYK